MLKSLIENQWSSFLRSFCHPLACFGIDQHRLFSLRVVLLIICSSIFLSFGRIGLDWMILVTRILVVIFNQTKQPKFISLSAALKQLQAKSLFFVFSPASKRTESKHFLINFFLVKSLYIYFSFFLSFRSNGYIAGIFGPLVEGFDWLIDFLWRSSKNQFLLGFWSSIFFFLQKIFFLNIIIYTLLCAFFWKESHLHEKKYNIIMKIGFWLMVIGPVLCTHPVCGEIWKRVSPKSLIYVRK